MNHAELSRQVALALGWPHVLYESRGGIAVSEDPDGDASTFYYFDYRSPDVALPLLEWLAQPYGLVELWPNEESWSIVVHDRSRICGRGKRIHAATLPEAIARAVLAVKGGEGCDG